MGRKDEGIGIDIVDQENEYKAWLSYSKMDYDCAVYLNLAPMYPRPLNIICYHCQQAAEKAAKALVVYYLCNRTLTWGIGEKDKQDHQLFCNRSLDNNVESCVRE